ncbi:hypothetical protein PcPA57_13050 [Pasteurella canis]|nr:hypothetical protein PcPA57_13050 [Pasteurella canis]
MVKEINAIMPHFLILLFTSSSLTQVTVFYFTKNKPNRHINAQSNKSTYVKAISLLKCKMKIDNIVQY